MTPQLRRRAWKHVRALAAEHNVKLRQVSRIGKAEAHVTMRVAWVAPMKDPPHYLSALHELGHIVAPAARRLHRRWDTDGIARCEASAWAWAVEHADRALLAEFTEENWSEVGFWFTTHLWCDQDGSARFLPDQVS